MDTINISLNKAILIKMKSVLPKKGYNNISEYIRDLLRRDLGLSGKDFYAYDYGFLKELAEEANDAVKKKKIKQLVNVEDLLE